ncbi:MAG: portal protein [Flavobacteriaceae bacterium]
MPISPSITTIIEAGNRLFEERKPLLLHWQELAEHFYFERADFTVLNSIGADYAANAMTSVPALARREMGNLYRAMLRPLNFFEIKATDDERNDQDDARVWLEYATKVMRAAMYRRGGNFTRATVTGDHDHVTFGQCAIEVCPTPERDALYYRTWHLRDVVWSEDYAGAVQDIHRKTEITLRMLVQRFGDKVPQKLRDEAEKNPFRKIEARHVVVPADAYDFGALKIRPGHRWVSIWTLPKEDVTLEQVPRSFRGYVVPRADTVSGSQYARSPFTSIILPDARTKMAIERILLEAGEKAIDPPMVGVEDVFRSDIGLYAGGLTLIDRDYDEKTGEALRPVNADYSGLPFGENMSERYDMVIREGMMLTKINLPDTSNMTAYQVRKIMEQHMRAHIPMFEPVEVEYNEPLCSETFDVMRSMGAFPASEIPEPLRGADVEFSFQSPLKDIENDGKAQKLQEGMAVVQIAASFDPSVAEMVDPMEITRDTLEAIGWPTDWTRNKDEIAARVQAKAEQMAAEKMAAEAAGAADAAGKAAPMVKAIADAGRAA